MFRTISSSNSFASAIPASGTSGPGLTYSIGIGGITGHVVGVRVTINVTHTFPDDLDFVLVASSSQKAFAFLTDGGGAGDITNASYTFSDTAASAFPDDNANVAVPGGTYRPASYDTPEAASNWTGTDQGAIGNIAINHPGPAGGATFASTFGGVTVGQTWKLYIQDDTGNDTGTFNGWTLSIDYNVSENDFDADGFSDILFQTNTGFLGMWKMNGSQILSAPGIGALPAGATVAGVGDFSGDGKSDILFQTDTGFLGMWRMNGSQVLASPGIGALPAGAHVAGVGNFNADTLSDILFQTDTGFLGMWQMNGSQILSAPGIGALPAGAHVAGVGDFNGDGRSDILFQTSNGFLGMWQMNGSQILSAPGIGALPANANVAQVEDFNGDGRSDILFQTDTGFLGIWLMNGSQILSAPGVGPLPANAHVVPHLDLL